MKKLFTGCTLLTVMITQGLIAQQYEIPPSSTTRGHVPTISDDAMEACVKIYNELNWLGKDIDKTIVNNYSQASVDSYNNKITKYERMQQYFNLNCAGKQSESARKAAEKLNKQNH